MPTAGRLAQQSSSHNIFADYGMIRPIDSSCLKHAQKPNGTAQF